MHVAQGLHYGSVLPGSSPGILKKMSLKITLPDGGAMMKAAVFY